MINLLKANFYRLKKSVSFWIILIIFFLLEIYIYFNNYTPNCVNCYNQLGDVFFEYTILNCLLMPIFICIFVGSDYNNGTLRNKIIVGHLRKNIYLSNLIISILVSIIYSLVGILTMSIIGAIFDNSFLITIDKFILLILASILLNISICSVFNFMAMIISSKGLSSIFSLSFIIFSLIFTSNLSYKISISSGIRKQILQFFYDFIPMGQAFQIKSLVNNCLTMIIYSIILIIIINFFGLFIFNKKELN